MLSKADSLYKSRKILNLSIQNSPKKFYYKRTKLIGGAFENLKDCEIVNPGKNNELLTHSPSPTINNVKSKQISLKNPKKACAKTGTLNNNTPTDKQSSANPTFNPQFQSSKFSCDSSLSSSTGDEVTEGTILSILRNVNPNSFPEGRKNLMQVHTNEPKKGELPYRTITPKFFIDSNRSLKSTAKLKK